MQNPTRKMRPPSPEGGKLMASPSQSPQPTSLKGGAGDEVELQTGTADSDCSGWGWGQGGDGYRAVSLEGGNSLQITTTARGSH